MLKISSALALTLFTTGCSGENAPVVPFQEINATPPSANASSSSGLPANAPTRIEESIVDAGATVDDAAAYVDAGTPESGTDAGDDDAGVVTGTDAGPAIDAGTIPTSGSVTFHPRRAVLAGSGCSDASASVALDGAGIRVSFSEMKIDLRGASALSDRRACAVRIPVDIPLGYYVARIDQKVNYSIRRSAGARAALSTSATVFGLPSSPYTISHNGARDETLAHASARNPVRFAAGSAEANAMCATGRSTGGMLALNLATTAQRDAAQSVAVAIDAFDFHEGVDVAIAKCP